MVSSIFTTYANIGLLQVILLPIFLLQTVMNCICIMCLVYVILNKQNPYSVVLLVDYLLGLMV